MKIHNESNYVQRQIESVRVYVFSARYTFKKSNEMKSHYQSGISKFVGYMMQ